MLDVEVLKKYVGEEHSQELEDLVSNCESSKLQNLTFKNPTIAMLLAIFLGFIGIDRLYQGGIKMMLVKLCIVVMTFGTWCIADFYFTRYTVQQDNYRKLMAAATAQANLA